MSKHKQLKPSFFDHNNSSVLFFDRPPAATHNSYRQLLFFPSLSQLVVCIVLRNYFLCLSAYYLLPESTLAAHLISWPAHTATTTTTTTITTIEEFEGISQPIFTIRSPLDFLKYNSKNLPCCRCPVSFSTLITANLCLSSCFDCSSPAHPLHPHDTGKLV